jgi:hypothetical protein
MTFVSRSAISLAVLFAAAMAQAQNWTAVSASNITDLNQNKLAAGQLCFLGTDQNDNPISFSVGGGGQVLKRAFCSPVAAGAVNAFTVPNPANTQPTGVYYRVTVKDASTGQEVLRYTTVTFTGATFSFDNYQPSLPGATLNPLSGSSVTGNLSVSGNLSVTGSASGANNFQAAALNTTTRGDRKISIQNPDFEGSSLIPPPGWAAPFNATLSYETGSPAPGKLQSLKMVSSSGTLADTQTVTRFSVAPGDIYSLVGMAKSDGNGIASVALDAYDKNGAHLSTVIEPTTTSTTWTQLAGSGTIPANAVQAAITLYNLSNTVSTVWFDQISAQKTSFPTSIQIVNGVADAGNNSRLGWVGASGANTFIGDNNGGVFIGHAGLMAVLGTSGLITTYGGVNTVANGVPAIVAKLDVTAQQVNIGPATIYTVPPNGGGMYRMSGYTVVTQPATTSSILPTLFTNWTDNDLNISAGATILNSNSSNIIGATGINATTAGGCVIINAKASTNITYSTSGYASTGTTAMQYALHIKLEYIGN